MMDTTPKDFKGAPKSKHFDDVYFSAQDGLAETRHVFLDGNGLPEAWQGRERFVICETGFGTGLNFLAVWKLFEETAAETQELYFISFEKYPLEKDEIQDALLPWVGELSSYPAQMLGKYPVLYPGFHHMRMSARTHLLLVFDDVNVALPDLDAAVDCWFLDGFKPAVNPQMWSDRVLQEMARLSKPGTSFATFTAAGDVRRGLQGVGFLVDKVPGYGRKRDMLVGRFEG